MTHRDEMDRMRRSRGRQFAAILVIAIAIGSGCVMRAGNWFELATFGSYYTHLETFSEAARVECSGGDGWEDCLELAGEIATAASGGSLLSWETHIGRTFGTVGLEAKITAGSETIAVTGKGISKNMSKVLGDDVIEKLAKVAACSMQPANPNCLATRGGLGERITKATEAINE